MMALEYDGHRIGAMQYNGVTIGEAMYNGQIVWSALKTPVDFGALSWLDFTNGAQDNGTQPFSWRVNGGTVSGGYGNLLWVGTDQVPTVDAMGDYGFSAWLNPQNTTVSTVHLIAMRRSPYALRVFPRQTNGTVEIRFQHGSTPEQSRTFQQPSGWSHIAAFMQHTSGTTYRATCYVNGVQVVNFTFNGGTQTSVSLGPSFWHYGASTGRESHIDDLAIYNKALSAEEVQLLYAQGRST